MENNNPSAFPLPQGSDTTVGSEGMTLRDYFANSAMQGHMASEYGVGVHGSYENDFALAKRYYEIADAMLFERQKSVNK